MKELKAEIVRVGMKQFELAELLGIGISPLNKMLNGWQPMPEAVYHDIKTILENTQNTNSKKYYRRTVKYKERFGSSVGYIIGETEWYSSKENFEKEHDKQRFTYGPWQEAIEKELMQ
jgi:hypothetical protein